jgi:U-box domain
VWRFRNYSVRDVLNVLYGLLLNPEFDTVLDTELAELYKNDRFRYEQTVRRAVEQHSRFVRAALWARTTATERAGRLDDIPEYLRCSLTGELLVDPVITPVARLNYSREALRRHIESGKHCDPVHEILAEASRPWLSMEDCMPNDALAVILASTLSQSEVTEEVD